MTIDFLFIGFIIVLVISYLYYSYKQDKKEKQFISNLSIGTPIFVNYYDDKGNIECDFHAKVKEINTNKNEVIIEYRDGSIAHEQLKGFNSLYQHGWKIEK